MDCPHFLLDELVFPDHACSSLKAHSKNRRTQCMHGPCSKGREGLWLCLTCGDLHCSRFIHGHALEHFKKTSHPVALDLETYTCHCYACDEYVDEEIVAEPVKKIRYFLNSRKTKKVNIYELATVKPTADAGSSNLADGRGTLSRSGHRKSNSKNVHVTGLCNLGNTCFMNVVLQALCHTVPLQHYYLAKTYGTPSDFHPSHHTRGTDPDLGSGPVTRQTLLRKDSMSICTEFCELLRLMWTTPSPSVTPEKFLNAVWRVVPSFRGYHQQDAQEFIRFLLDKVNAEMFVRSPRTIITRTFQGSLFNQVTCLHCGHISTKKDLFLDLSLPIPERFLREKNKVSQQVNPCTLKDCLDAFTETEVLANTELYNCHKCKLQTQCTKKLSVDKLPPVLAFHLKRFRYTRSNRSKIDTYVQFPITDLDMRPYMKEVEDVGRSAPPSSSSPRMSKKSASPVSPACTLYDLYSIIVHQGSCGSGHYYSYVWSPQNDTWMRMNDSTARVSKAEELAMDQAYVLFYLRRDAHPPSPPPASTDGGGGRVGKGRMANESPESMNMLGNQGEQQRVKPTTTSLTSGLGLKRFPDDVSSHLWRRSSSDLGAIVFTDAKTVVTSILPDRSASDGSSLSEGGVKGGSDSKRLRSTSKEDEDWIPFLHRDSVLASPGHSAGLGDEDALVCRPLFGNDGQMNPPLQDIHDAGLDDEEEDTVSSGGASGDDGEGGHDEKAHNTNQRDPNLRQKRARPRSSSSGQGRVAWRTR